MYNINVIIAAGYRVNSYDATQFRIGGAVEIVFSPKHKIIAKLFGRFEISSYLRTRNPPLYDEYLGQASLGGLYFYLELCYNFYYGLRNGGAKWKRVY